YITALSFVFFAKQKADIAVLETGLGGRFDATNIIEKPLICIISSISYDHKAVLGNSIKKIAFEKAGIIKAGAKTIVSNLHQDALDIISKKTCPYIFGSDFKVSNISFKYGVPKFDYSFTDKTILKNIRLQNFGFHQIQNASLSLCAADLLKQKGFILKEAQIKKALYNVKVAARFDLRNLKIKGQKIKLIIDGAHNEEALKAFVSQWRSLKLKKGVFIFAIMKDKEYKKTVKILAPMAKQIILPKLKSQRALMPAILKKEFSKYISNSNIAIAASVKDALTLLKKTDICAAVGSLYLAGEVFENTKLKI
ncbi:MAG: hypothetical protein LBT79_06130, partial [Elusimicrobiota bacterium]|nr:hypothetical protein [Elusimicrobiota bacterium]